MIYARKKRGNIIFITKRRAEIWKYEFFVVYLHRILKRRYKELRNYEGEVDKFSGRFAGKCGQ